MLMATKRAGVPVQGVCFVRDGLCNGEKQLVPRLTIEVSRESSHCSGGYSHWMRGALPGGVWAEIVFPDVPVSPQSTGWRGAGSWLPSFVSSIKRWRKQLENTYSIFLSVSFVAWLPCALVQSITCCSSWLFTFPFLSAHMLGSASPPQHTQSTAPTLCVY